MVVVGAAGAGQVRQLSQYFASERRGIGGGNRSVRGIELAGKRIDHWNGKIPGAVAGRRNAVEVENFRQLAEAFVVAEEEEPILDDWSADGSAELIALQQGLLEGRGSLSEDVADGVQIGIAQELVSRAMKLVPTGARGYTDHRATGPPVLRAVVVGDDLELRHGIGRRLRHLIGETLVAGAVGIVVDAIEQEVVIRAAHPVHVEGALAGSRRGGQRRAVYVGSQQGQVRVGAAVERQFHHLFCVDDLSVIARVRLEDTGGPADLDRFGDFSNRQIQIHALPRVDIDSQVGGNSFGEARSLGGDCVPADSDTGKFIIPFRVSGLGDNNPGIEICQRDFGAWQGAAGLIPHGSQHTSGVKLSETRYG